MVKINRLYKLVNKKIMKKIKDFKKLETLLINN